MRTILILIAGWVALGCVPTARGDAPASSPMAAEAFFEKRVRPVLAEKCWKCHGEKKHMSGLRLDSRQAILKGGEEGAVVKPGDPEASRLISAIRHEDGLEMPPEDKLKPEAIAALTQWIRMGLPWPAAGSNTADEKRARIWKSHWAFQPVGKPAVPEVKDVPGLSNQHWPRSPIDRFVLAKLTAHSLRPSPSADRRTWIRRTTFDLIGLSPTPEEAAAFESDSSPDAFAKVVDRLLASPHYGERYGRHWLDVARYADNKGAVFFEQIEFPWSYTYRDYVTRSLNEDVPYNRFVLEQLAADQLDLGSDKRALAAMGFLTLGGRFMNNQHDVIDDRIDVISRGLLGLTVTCARCHDHKYDPIPQADYYSLYGVFRSSIEPTIPPLFLPAPDTQQYNKFHKQLQVRAKALQQFMAGKHTALVTSSRTRAADYLLAAEAARSQPDTDKFMAVALKDGLNPTMVIRWTKYLKKTAKGHHPVWAPWHELAAIGDREFAEKAATVTKRIETAADSRHPINPLIHAALAGKPPSSMKELAERYSRLLNQVDHRWQESLKQAAKAKRPTPKRLVNQAEEELREVFYGPKAPPDVPMIPGAGNLALLPDRDTQAVYKKLRKAVETWISAGSGTQPRAMVLVDSQRPFDARIFLRGNSSRLGKPVPRQFLSALAGSSRKPFTKGSGRLELARAIVDPANPLTPRVIVNRIWHHHFGAGLVRTPSDFGLRGERPTHPDLLDHLASKFMATGWSIKCLHRQIMLSAVYRQASDDRDAAQAADPENRLLWKMNRRRLDFEAARDALIAVAGRLDGTIGGKPMRLFGKKFVPRRTLYGFVDRTNLPGLMRAFDFPNPSATSPKRDGTMTAPQALFMMNHPLVSESARGVLARAEITAEKDAVARVDRLHRLFFGRAATAEEVSLSRDFLSPGPGVPSHRAWRYGYGKMNESGEQLKQFVDLTSWTGSRWQGGSALPDPKIGWVLLEAKGGHPGGKSPYLTAVRRWTSPIAGTVQIQGTIRHAVKKGDGVCGRIVSSRSGGLGQWEVAKSSSETSIARVEVRPGETIDFIVDCRGGEAHDQFEWIVSIRQTSDARAPVTAGQWHSLRDFRGRHVDRWHQYVQALLMTNEFAFVD